MKSLTMMVENVQLDVYYEAEICKNSNGVGGPATCEVTIKSIDCKGDILQILQSSEPLERIENFIIAEELGF